MSNENNKVNKSREMLTELVELKHKGKMNEIVEFIDGLDELSCKYMLRMIVYGDYTKFYTE